MCGCVDFVDGVGGARAPRWVRQKATSPCVRVLPEGSRRITKHVRALIPVFSRNTAMSFGHEFSVLDVSAPNCVRRARCPAKSMRTEPAMSKFAMSSLPFSKSIAKIQLRARPQSTSVPDHMPCAGGRSPTSRSTRCDASCLLVRLNTVVSGDRRHCVNMGAHAANARMLSMPAAAAF